MKARVLGSYGAVDAAAWDRLVGDGSPFLEHTFLWSLEALGSASPATGWTPRPIVVEDDDGRLVGGAPGWVKTHSMGEFVYDHAWADAARRAGLRYYPKLVIGAPFSPVTGQRLLVAPDADAERVREALLRGIEEAARDCNGVHVLFDTEADAAWLGERGLFPRVQTQFHWFNQGYETFEDWLRTFPSDKRNKLRRERKEVAGLRFEARTPDEADLRALHRFHRNTADQFGPWGNVYLSEGVFVHLGRVWADRLQAVLAFDGDRPVAGTFNVRKGDRLYGRYWGCDDAVKFLHFEVCYYQPIEACIREGLQVFEPGHGGTHKYRRGFRPTVTWSSHRLRDPRLHGALAQHVALERQHVFDAVAAEREGAVRPAPGG